MIAVDLLTANPELVQLITGARMHPGAPRDVDLAEWRDGAGFHPADTPLKQAGHALTRELVGLLGTHLHQLLPPGRDKAMVFTALEDVLMRANRALALGGGPRSGVLLETVQAVLDDTRRIADDIGKSLPSDPRIAQYEAGQRAEPEFTVPDDPDAASEWLDRANAAVGAKHPGVGWVPTAAENRERPDGIPLFDESWTPDDEEPGLRHSVTVSDPILDAGYVELRTASYNEGENLHESVQVEISSADSVEALAAALLSARNRAWPA